MTTPTAADFAAAADEARATIDRMEANGFLFASHADTLRYDLNLVAKVLGGPDAALARLHRVQDTLVSMPIGR